ncbi:CheR family methyltransferase [Hydrogenophaga sp.]|uniref:CheR family methyltransferase n=1 Tax=Hydrogenophaga sp. TaxID=1904254 RepID=UPI002FC82337
MPAPVQDAQWSRLSDFIARRMGLHFPCERWDDLQRGLADAAQEFGLTDPAACIDWLLSAPPTQGQLQVLANHFTIGETYFFRDQPTLQALAEHILPPLIRARRGRERRLRIWSAACCSGEEPYSLAILLHELLSDLQDWHVTITATDINARFLHKAAAGIYGDWSFRGAPAWLRSRYFKRTADGRYAVVPEIKRMVRFAHLNLVEDVYPSLATDTHAMDVIFCRNVLMYFTPSQMGKVVDHLHHALIDGGWLAVSPTEASQTLFPQPQFATANFPGAVLFRKSAVPLRSEPPAMAFNPAPAFFVPAVDESLPSEPTDPAGAGPRAMEAAQGSLASAESLYREGRYGEVVDTLLTLHSRRAHEPATCSLLARALANQGKLGDALTWCERWIASDKLNAAAHYLRAVALLEQGDAGQARTSLQRALYLDHNFVLAHYALGNLERGRGKIREADKHFANALHLLRQCQPNDPLPESDGLTAGRLAETINSVICMEASP